MTTLWTTPPATPAPPSERDVQRESLLRLGRNPALMIWRRMVGTFFPPEIVRHLCPACQERATSFRRVKVGIPGEGDAGGVLAPNGRAFWVEFKSATGEQRKQQQNFERAVRQRGGIYVIARSADEAEAGMQPYIDDPGRP